jgi:hypothetical protein
MLEVEQAVFKHFFETHGLRAWAEYKACVAGVIRGGQTDADTLHRLLETFFADEREMALHNALIVSMLEDVYIAVSNPGREVPKSSPYSSSSNSVSPGEVDGAAGVPPASYQHLGMLSTGESAESISEHIQKDWSLRLHDAHTGVQAGAGAGAGQHGDDLASLAMAVATQLARIDKGGLV